MIDSPAPRYARAAIKVVEFYGARGPYHCTGSWVSVLAEDTKKRVHGLIVILKGLLLLQVLDVYVLIHGAGPFVGGILLNGAEQVQCP
jgi:hypothetical protein